MAVPDGWGQSIGYEKAAPDVLPAHWQVFFMLYAAAGPMDSLETDLSVFSEYTVASPIIHLTMATTTIPYS